MKPIGYGLLVILVLTTAPTTPLEAQDMRTEFTVEARLLDRDFELYAEARQRESEAIGTFRSLAARVDATLLDPNSALSTLRDLEARLSAARETAYLRSQETGAARLRIYERMERLVQLARAMERNDPSSLAATDGPSGLWQIDLEAIEASGLMKLVVEGQLVTGSYRLSNGNRGSVSGTWSGGRLNLEVIHAELGRVGRLEGELDAARAGLRGRWGATDVASGQPAVGLWSATLVTDEPALELDR